MKQQEVGTGVRVSQKHWQGGILRCPGGMECVCSTSPALQGSSYLLSADNPSLSYLEKPIRTGLPGRRVTSHCIPPLW